MVVGAGAVVGDVVEVEVVEVDGLPVMVLGVFAGASVAGVVEAVDDPSVHDGSAMTMAKETASRRRRAVVRIMGGAWAEGVRVRFAAECTVVMTATSSPGW